MRSFSLGDNELHLWPVRLNALNSALEVFRKALAIDELERADRYRFSQLRREFTIARGALRHILAWYLATEPRNIRLEYGAKGKPYIAERSCNICFNLAHSNGLAVLGVTRRRDLGVDIEYVRAISDLPQVAQRFFCPEEASELSMIAQQERQRAFFLCWTRKEAYIKAVGHGLALPLSSFRVTLQPNRPARFVHIGHDVSLAQTWTLHDLALCPEYVGAIAYYGRPRTVVTAPVTNGDLLLSSEFVFGDERF